MGHLASTSKKEVQVVPVQKQTWVKKIQDQQPQPTLEEETVRPNLAGSGSQDGGHISPNILTSDRATLDSRGDDVLPSFDERCAEADNVDMVETIHDDWQLPKKTTSPSRAPPEPTGPVTSNSFTTLEKNPTSPKRWANTFDEELEANSRDSMEAFSSTTLTAAEQSYLLASGGKVSPKDPLGKTIRAKQKQARKEEFKRREEYNTRLKAKKNALAESRGTQAGFDAG